MMKRVIASVAGIVAVLLVSAAAQAELKLVANFDGLTGGPDGQACNGVLGGTLDTEGEATGNSSLPTQDGSTTMSIIGHSSGTLARAIGFNGITNPIDDGETGVGFFRFMMATGGNIRTHMGLISDTTNNPIVGANARDPLTVPAGFKLVENGTGFDLATTDGATVLKTGLARSQWYNVWIVADNGADTFDLYLSIAAGPAGAATLPTPADLVKSGIPFGVATTGLLNGMIFANPIGTGQATRIYVDEIWWDGDQGLSKPNNAKKPSPAGGVVDVPRDVILSWTPGPFAATHDVYFGTSRADVDSATSASPLGVLAGAGQDANTFDPAGLLEFGKTYYWRVDEVNAAPDSTAVKGDVWSFTVEPYAYAITNVTATASSSYNADMGPEKTVDGSGLDAAGLHGTTDNTMWLSSGAGPEPAWIRYEFNGVYKLDEMQVWNSNQAIEALARLGAKSVTVEYSTDGSAWTQLAGVPEFAQAPGAAGYASNITVDFGGAAAKFVRLIINSSWSGKPPTGLSEVRFYYVPVRAREPKPTAGQTHVNPNDVVLIWRSGREAASHKLYLSTDKQAVVDGTAPVVTPSEASYAPSSLELGATYYWKVVEVNHAASPPTWEGDIWSFSTTEYLAIDDFESYTNDSPNRIFQTWVDGYGYSEDEFFPTGHPGNGTGAAVGHDIWTTGGSHYGKTIAETVIVHGGKQSMPLYYDNSSVASSEAERTWKTAENWTTNGASTLTLYFRGTPIGLLERSPGNILMNGVGTDIYGTADQGRFVYKQLTGDGSIVARVNSLTNTNAWAKAGVMIRQTIEAGSSWALVLASPANGVHFQARLTSGGGATSDTTLTLPTEQTSAQIPVWVKLERKGDQFSGYYATGETPTTWTPIPWNPQTITMTGAVYIGLAVTSHAAGVVTQAEFSGVTTTGNVTGSWQSASLGIDQPAGNVPDALYLTVEDTSGRKATVVNTDPYAVNAGVWTPWSIPLSTFTSAGVKTNSIKKMTIGVGDKAKPASKATGLIYIDDIGYGWPAPTALQP
jgi:hypothetical protein